MPFSSSQELGAVTYASSITEVVVDALVKSNRFLIVDRTHFDHIYTEENLQKGESFIEGQVVEQGKKIGAALIVTGELISASASEVYEEEGEGKRKEKKVIGYVAALNFSLKVISVETGEIIASENLSSNSGKILLIEIPHHSEETAISNAIQGAREEVLDFLDDYFPVQAVIFEVIRDSNRKVHEVVVTAGKLKGMREGQMLKVVEVRQVMLNGQEVTRHIELGTLRVKSVTDDHFSTCKVIKGKDQIKDKLDANAMIQVISGQDKSKFGEMIDAISIPAEVISDWDDN